MIYKSSVNICALNIFLLVYFYSPCAHASWHLSDVCVHVCLKDTCISVAASQAFKSVCFFVEYFHRLLSMCVSFFEEEYVQMWVHMHIGLCVRLCVFCSAVLRSCTDVGLR